jgi:type III restriction enzyme
MKLHFEPNLDYQLQAIEAVCDLFRKWERCTSVFTVSKFFGDLPGFDNTNGYGNWPDRQDETVYNEMILEDLLKVQLRHGLKPSQELKSRDFTVEMETGTGKTYVYLRTVFELNRRFGFTKFVVVVPSVAIKEGVYKSLQIMEEHFRALYANTPFEYFVYDSAKLGQVRNFATSPNIQVMVVTVGSIVRFGDEAEAEREEADEVLRREKSKNVMYRRSEKTGGEKPVDLLRATRPILIVDEPQSVDGGLDGKGRQALARMNPLCTLRYSATHVDKHHMVFRLDAVDAYERKLVKQIEVAAAAVEGGHNKPFVRLVSVSSKRGVVSAKVELDVEVGGRVQRQEV